MPSLFAVVRLNLDPSDTHAARVLPVKCEHLGLDACDCALTQAAIAARELANPDDLDVVEVKWVHATDAGAARLVTPKLGWWPFPFLRNEEMPA